MFWLYTMKATDERVANESTSLVPARREHFFVENLETVSNHSLEAGGTLEASGTSAPPHTPGGVTHKTTASELERKYLKKIGDNPPGHSWNALTIVVLTVVFNVSAIGLEKGHWTIPYITNRERDILKMTLAILGASIPLYTYSFGNNNTLNKMHSTLLTLCTTVDSMKEDINEIREELKKIEEKLEGHVATTKIKIIRHPVDDNGISLKDKTPKEAILFEHDLEGCHTGMEVAATANEKNHELFAWEMDIKRIRQNIRENGDFEIRYILNQDGKITASSKDFKKMTKQAILLSNNNQSNLLEIEVVLKRITKSQPRPAKF